MRVKSPMGVVLGIFCLLCFVTSIVQGKDLFTIALCLFTTVMEFIAGLGGKE